MLYSPGHFQQCDPDQILGLILARPLAVLVTVGGGRILVSHVPMRHVAEAEGPGHLIGHLARANPQAREYDETVEAIAVFTGPNTYVSPSAYATKRETGKVVPTWNYAAVYAFGRLEFLDDHDGKHGVVDALTTHFESNREPPWAVSDAPDEFVKTQLTAVRGFRFRIARLEGKWKLSQNRSEADRSGVMRDLGESTDGADNDVAAMMRALYGAPDAGT